MVSRHFFHLVGVGREVSGAQCLTLSVQVLVIVLGPRLPEEVLQGAASDVLDDHKDGI